MSVNGTFLIIIAIFLLIRIAPFLFEVIRAIFELVVKIIDWFDKKLNKKRNE